MTTLSLADTTTTFFISNVEKKSYVETRHPT